MCFCNLKNCKLFNLMQNNRGYSGGFLPSPLPTTGGTSWMGLSLSTSLQELQNVGCGISPISTSLLGCWVAMDESYFTLVIIS